MERKNLHKTTTNTKIEAIKRKKKERRKKQVIVLSITGIIFLLLVVGFFYIPYFAVKKIEINGALALNSDTLRDTVATSLEGKKLLVLPKKNIFLVHKNDIRENLKNTYPLIDTVRIKKTFSGMIVSITERDPETLWCSIQSRAECYFVHADGTIFEKASVTSNPLFFVFFTPLDAIQNPLNHPVLDTDAFARIKQIKEVLKKYNITIYGYMYVSPTEEWLFLHPIQHTLPFESMSHITMYTEQTPEVVVSKIVTALKNETLRKQKENDFLQTAYIDIRFTEQISFKLK